MPNQESKIKSNVLNLIAEKFGLESNSLSGNIRFLEDLGADSLDLVELLVIIEKEFGYDIPESDMVDLKTISDLVEYLAANLEGAEQ